MPLKLFCKSKRTFRLGKHIKRLSVTIWASLKKASCQNVSLLFAISAASLAAFAAADVAVVVVAAFAGACNVSSLP